MTRTRHRGWWWLLAVAFVVVPLVEVYLLVQLGQVIGPWWTILVLVVAGVLGSLLVKREGGRAWRALQAALTSRRMPATELADGALILIGGTLLLTPGFLTDVVGLLCILPFTRPLARRVLSRVITRRLTQSMAQGMPGTIPGFMPGASPFPPTAGPRKPGPTTRRGSHEVVPGEVVDDG